MMSRHFRLKSELSRAIAKRLPHANYQLSVPGSFFNQFVTEIYIYTRAKVFEQKPHTNSIKVGLSIHKRMCTQIVRNTLSFISNS